MVGPTVYYLLTYSPSLSPSLSLSQVTEDLKVITEEDEAAVPEDGGGSTKAPESPSPPRAPLPLPPLSLRPPLRRTPSLSKRESLMSINRYNASCIACLFQLAIAIILRSQASPPLPCTCDVQVSVVTNSVCFVLIFVGIIRPKIRPKQMLPN